jgi:hypothetical protein
MERYEKIKIIVNGVAIGPFPGTSTSFRTQSNGMDISDMDFCVVGFRGETPSNAAAIHLGDNAQDELFGIPFAGGVSPNWAAWLSGGQASDAQFQGGIRDNLIAIGNPFNPIRRPETKPFFQVITTLRAGVKAGVWRRFLGLTPGHKYRISALLNTLAMDSAKGNWSFSLHATCCGAEGDLTLEQLSGLEKLPDGSVGDNAGLIAGYKPGRTTKGQWAFCSTADNMGAEGSEVGDIELPPGADSIAVWVRHSAEQSKGVGLLWVKLEDLSMDVGKPIERR